VLGRAYYFICDCPLALINLNKAASRNPSNLETHVYLAACMVQMENLEAAEWEIEEILGNAPEFSLAFFFQS
jgi:Flp pilus assembly protein TadD